MANPLNRRVFRSFMDSGSKSRRCRQRMAKMIVQMRKIRRVRVCRLSPARRMCAPRSGDLECVAACEAMIEPVVWRMAETMSDGISWTSGQFASVGDGKERRTI